MSSAPAPPPRLDRINQCLWLGDRRADLSANAFRLLDYLIERPGQLVSKDALLDAVWPDAHVVDAVLSVTISHLREALGDDPRQPRFIETLHRRGYRWIGAFAPETPGRPSADAAGPALVGRDAALAQLDAAAARAAAGRRQTVFVTGEPGIGKTTLVDHFLASVAAQRSVVARGQCIDGYGRSEAYLPLLEALQQVVYSCDDAIEILRSRAPTWLLQLPGLLSPADHDELRRSLASSTGARMVRELQQVLEALSADRTLVLVLEDLHWGDAATVSVLGGLAMRREPARLLVIATYRPVDAVAELHPIVQLEHELAARRQCIEIALDGLEVDAVASYLAARFADAAFPSDLARRLHAQTAGNPLFLLNAVEDLEQREWLVRVDGAWCCHVDAERLDHAVPESTRAMIDARLGRLPAALLAMLEAASVIGPSFASQTVAAALDRDAGDVELDCTALARAGRFVKEIEPAHWPDGSSGAQYAFRHTLYQQVLYGRVTAARRQSLERAVAGRLERGFGDAPEVAGLLATHWERGGDVERAVAHQARAAGIARSRYDFEQAAAQYRHALDLLRRLPASAERDAREIVLQSELVTTVFSTTGPGAAEIEDIAGRIDTLSSAAETTPALLNALFGLIALCITRGDLGRAEALGQGVLHRAAEVDWGAFQAAVARGLLGFTQHRRGCLTAATPNLTAGAALPLIGAVGMLEPSIGFESDLGFTHFLMGELRRGLETMHHADARAGATGHPPTIVYSSSNMIRIGQMIGDRALVDRAAVTMGEIADRLAQPRFAAYRLICIGWLGMDAGDPEGLATFREGVRIMAADSHLVYAPFSTCQAAAGFVRLGRLDDARATLAEAFRLLEATEARWCEPDLHRVQAALSLASSPRGKGWARATREAERSLRRAIDVAQAQGARWWELRAWFDLAKLGPDAGDATAIDALRRLHTAIDEGSAIPVLDDVRAFLAARPA
ncbi:MAG: AAA family ATPase [bacterium]|nr:AAA family ATPase [bacterium]